MCILDTELCVQDGEQRSRWNFLTYRESYLWAVNAVKKSPRALRVPAGNGSRDSDKLTGIYHLMRRYANLLCMIVWSASYLPENSKDVHVP